MRSKVASGRPFPKNGPRPTSRQAARSRLAPYAKSGSAGWANRTETCGSEGIRFLARLAASAAAGAILAPLRGSVELPYAEEPQRRRRLEPLDDQPRAVALENDAGGRSRDEPERPRDTGRGGRDLRQDVRRLGCGLTRRHGERVAVARLDAG